MPRELRFAFRSLRKSPGFAIAAVATLALGMGANSAMFSVIDAVLIKPLPYRDADRLMLIYTTSPGVPRNFVSQPDLDDWRAQARSFTGIASLIPQSVNLIGGDRPERLVGDFVSSNYFEVLGARAALGRTFATGEDRARSAPVVILTDGAWRAHFGADPSVLGRKAIFNGEAYTIVGVMGPEFREWPWDSEVFLPANKYTGFKVDRGVTIGAALGRLRDGVTVREARTEMNGVASRLAAAYPETNRDRGTLLVGFQEDFLRNMKPALVGLEFAVGFVLLIGCANVAGLFGARVVAGERERRIRVALGASRARLIAQLMAEAAVIAVSGGAIGWGIAAWVAPALSKTVSNYLPTQYRFTLDAQVFLFSAAVVMVTVFLIAAIPAWQSTRAHVAGRGAVSGRHRTRSLMVAGEIAMALVLLVGAGLTLKSLAELSRARPGFDTRGLVTFEYRVPPAKYKTPASQAEFHRRVIEEIHAIPGVVDAASVRAVPLGGNGEDTDFYPADRPEADVGHRPRADFNAADPYFFSTMRIPVLRGRVFTEADSGDAAKVVVINQTLAARFFADRDPIGRKLEMPFQRLTAEIVGVVGDVKQGSLEEPERAQIWSVLGQNPYVFTSVAVRVAGDSEAMMNELRRAVWRVDQDQPVWRMRTMDERLAMLAAPREFSTGLLGAYAALALLLASVGIFGVVSYSVRQRTAEIGVRMALGAGRGDIVRMVLRQAAAMVGAGVAMGGMLAAIAGRSIASQLYRVSPVDVPVYVAVAGLLAIVALAASLIPARRAMRVDPMEALRHE